MAGSQSNTKSPGPGLRPASIPSGILMHRAVWPLQKWAKTWGGGLGPHVTVAWAEAYLHTKYHLDPSSRLATIIMCRKLGGSAPFWGGGAGSPSNTKSPTSVPNGILIHAAIWPQQICAENWGLYPFGRGAGSPSNTMCPGPRPTCMPSFSLIHSTVWPQYTNVTNRTGQTDRTTVR